MTATVTTQAYQSDILHFAHAEMAREFDVHAATAAGAMPRKLSHVYEWRMSGNPAGQLWRHKLLGVMGQKIATFEWIASKAPILTPMERKENPNDPMSGVSDDDIARLSQRRYIFYWKAPMMEYNMQTTIRPVWSKALFIPDWNAKRGFVITKGPFQKRAGGPEQAGAFGTLWTEWWSTQADAVFESRIKRIVEDDLANSVEIAGRIKKAPGKTTIRMSSITSAAAARATGEAMARAYLYGKAKSYRAASRYILEGPGGV